MASRRLRHRAGLDQHDVNGFILVFDGPTLLLLNPNASEIWREIDGARSDEEIAAAIVGRYPEQAEAVRTDVQTFLAEAVGSGLLLSEPTQGSVLRTAQVAAYTLDNDALLLMNLATGRRLTLTGPGRIIWNAAVERTLLDRLLQDLEELHPDAGPQVAADTTKLVGQLAGEGLVTIVSYRA